MDRNSHSPSDYARLQQENTHLRRAVDELASLNNLATALGTAQNVEQMLHRIVQSALKAARAEQGTITLVEAPSAADARTLIRTMAGSSEQPVFRPGDELLGLMQWHGKPLRVDAPQSDPRFPHAPWAASVTSLLAVPMQVRGTLVGVLTLFNKRGQNGQPQPFDGDDERLVAILAAQSAQIVENARVSEERDRVRRMFGQHTDPAVVDALLHSRTELSPARRHVCVMFVDVRDFTRFAEQAAPEAVLDYLNSLFWIMIAEVNRHGGVVHQLLGDGLMALFGAPLSRGNDCRNAVRAARAIVERLEGAVAAGAVPQTRIGIGLHAGEGVVGLVGSSLHREYKVTGDVVNLAARIEGLNKELDTTVLASDAVCKAAGAANDTSSLGPIHVRGRHDPVVLHRLV